MQESQHMFDHVRISANGFPESAASIFLCALKTVKPSQLLY